MNRRATTIIAFLLGLPGPLAAQQDLLTIGSVNGSSPGIADVPVYLRDVSGTPLGRERPLGLRIQGVSFQVSFAPSAVSSVTAQRAGILGPLSPLFEAIPTTSSTIGYLASFRESSDLVPLTLDAPGYGDRIGTLRFVLPAGLSAGTRINLTPSAATTTLVSNQAGTTVESPEGQLAAAPGTIVIGSFWGDANLDGVIDVFDAVVLASYLVGNLTPGQAPFLGTTSAMNLNPAVGTSVDVFDFVLLTGKIVGNVTTLPVP